MFQMSFLKSKTFIFKEKNKKKSFFSSFSSIILFYDFLALYLPIGSTLSSITEGAGVDNFYACRSYYVHLTYTWNL